jgi:hypothetical protein
MKLRYTLQAGRPHAGKSGEAELADMHYRLGDRARNWASKSACSTNGSGIPVAAQ